MICACYCIFNEFPQILFSINSICDYVDKIIVVDGPFIGFPHTSLVSTDGTLEALKHFGEKIEYITVKEAMRQPDKLSMFFGVESDWYFILGGDEVAVGNVKAGFDKVRNSPDLTFSIVIRDIKREPVGTYPRFVKYQEGLHFNEVHWLIRNKANEIVVPYHNPPLITEFTLINMPRTEQRKQDMAKYREYRRLHSGVDHPWEGA